MAPARRHRPVRDPDIPEIRAIGQGKLEGVFDHEERSLLRYADAMVDGSVTDADHQHMTRHYDEGQIVAIGLLVGFYTGLCRYISAADLPFEGGEFVGWVPEEALVAELFE